MTDSKTMDAQAGYEKALTTLAAVLAGGNMVATYPGAVGSLMGQSFEGIVIDNDMMGAALRILRGVYGLAQLAEGISARSTSTIATTVHPAPGSKQLRLRCDRELQLRLRLAEPRRVDAALRIRPMLLRRVRQYTAG